MLGSPQRCRASGRSRTRSQYHRGCASVADISSSSNRTNCSNDKSPLRRCGAAAALATDLPSSGNPSRVERLYQQMMATVDVSIVMPPSSAFEAQDECSIKRDGRYRESRGGTERRRGCSKSGGGGSFSGYNSEDNDDGERAYSPPRHNSKRSRSQAVRGTRRHDDVVPSYRSRHVSSLSPAEPWEAYDKRLYEKKEAEQQQQQQRRPVTTRGIAEVKKGGSEHVTSTYRHDFCGDVTAASTLVTAPISDAAFFDTKKSVDVTCFSHSCPKASTDESRGRHGACCSCCCIGATTSSIRGNDDDDDDEAVLPGHCSSCGVFQPSRKLPECKAQLQQQHQYRCHGTATVGGAVSSACCSPQRKTETRTVDEGVTCQCECHCCFCSSPRGPCAAHMQGDVDTATGNSADVKRKSALRMSRSPPSTNTRLIATTTTTTTTTRGNSNDKNKKSRKYNNSTRDTEGRREESKQDSVSLTDALRTEFRGLCKCYWKQFADLEMPINPASHAASCPCSVRQAAFDYIQEQKEAEATKAAARRHGSPSTSSIEMSSDDEDGEQRARRQQCWRGSTRRSGAAEKQKDEVKLSIQTTRSASAAARSAVFGSSKRKSVFDVDSSDDDEKENAREGCQCPSSANGTAAGTTSTGTESDAAGRKGSEEGGEAEATDGGATKHESPLSLSKKAASHKGRPGPGSYNIDAAYQLSSTAPSARNVGIGKGPRMPKETSITPGPGAYNIAGESTAASVDGVTSSSSSPAAAPFLTSRTRELTFNADHMDPHSPHRLQAAPAPSTTPGPADYRSESALSAEARFPKAPAYSFPQAAQRAGNEETNEGDIDGDSDAEGAEGRRAKKTQRMPGPADYDIRTGDEIGYAQGRSAIIGTSPSRRDMAEAGVGFLDARGGPAEATPGPGQYNPQEADRLTTATAPAPSFGVRWWQHDGIENGEEALAAASATMPGPGQYDHAEAFLRSSAVTMSPQWTIGGGAGGNTRGGVDATGAMLAAQGRGQDDMVSSNASPGPGEYDPMYAMYPSRSAIVGTAPRLVGSYRNTRDGEDDDGGWQSPGPGAYTVDLSRDVVVAQSHVMSKAPRGSAFEKETRRAEQIPGPASYDVKYALVETRAPVPLLSTTAATGIYGDGDAALGVASSSSSSHYATPGPGHYELAAALDATTTDGRYSGAGVFGTAPRRFHSAEDMEEGIAAVGPGTYNLPEISSGPSYSFSTQARAEAAPGTAAAAAAAGAQPGPGMYDPQHDIRFAKSSAVLLSATSPRFTVTAAEREQLQVPGPGSYGAAADDFALARAAGGGQQSNGPSFGMAPRILDEAEERKRREMVGIGPGSYDPDGVAAAADRIGGGASRAALMLTEARFPNQGSGVQEGEEMIPGPGSYVVQESAVVADARSATFGTAPARPGPGGSSDEGTGTSTTAVPGPAAYSVQYSAVEPSPRAVAFGTAAKWTSESGVSNDVEAAAGGASSGVGPGAYDPRAPSRGQYPLTTFPRAPRDVVDGEDGAGGVGPGHYSPNDPCLHVPAHAFGTASRALHSPQEGEVSGGTAAPGPGTYEVVVTRDGTILWQTQKGVVLGSAPRDGIIGDGGASSSPAMAGGSDTPGPGAYDLNARALLPQTPQYTFGKSERRPHYSEQTSKDEAARGPGPGEYLPQTAVPSLPDRYKGVRFGTEVRFVSDHDEAQMNDTPGPGYYDTSSAINGDEAAGVMMKSAPAYGFGTAPRMAPQESGAYPGPGEYDLTTAAAAAMARGSVPIFGSAPRFPSSSSTLEGDAIETGKQLGPGSYDVYAGSAGAVAGGGGGPAYSFPRALREGAAAAAAAAESAATPGPGAYLLSSGVDSSAPTVSSGYRGGPATSFGTAPRDTHAQELLRNAAELPGPGHYQVLSRLPEGPKYGFGTAAVGRDGGAGGAEDFMKTVVPGPGAYDIARSDQYTNASPAFSIHRIEARPLTAQERESMQTPGPGQYSATTAAAAMTARAPAAVMPTAPRFIIDGGASLASGSAQQDAPGPGYYDHPQHAAMPTITIPRAPRVSEAALKAKEAVPGPGSYSVNVAEGGQQGSGASALRLTAPRFVDVLGGKTENEVGPGHYTLPDPLAPSRTGPSFPLAGRFTSAEAVEGATSGVGVGPGAYDVRGSAAALASEAGKYSFGTAPRNVSADAAAGVNNNSSTPGPGSYDAAIVPSGPAFSLLSRRDMPGGLEDTPGPGTYTLASGNHARAATITGKPVDRDGREGVPGPGSYDTVLRPAGPAFSIFGKPADVDTAGMREVPGPGSYDVLSAAGRQAQQASGYSFGTAPRTAVNGGDPSGGGSGLGPGTYAPNNYGIGAVSGGFTFPYAARQGSSHTIAPSSGVLGPGEYTRFDTLGDNGLYQSSGPTMTFPHAPRMADASASAASNIGPGQYHRASEWREGAAKAVTFGSSERPTLNSGTSLETPGPGAYHSQSVPPTTGITFGIGDRPSVELNPYPGPGAYYKAPELSGGVTFARAERLSQEKNNYPGPGAYYHNNSNTTAGGSGGGGVKMGAVATQKPRERQRSDEAATIRKLAKAGYPVHSA